MQIVIDIPEEIKAIIDKNGTNEIVTETLWQAIKNGTPLPKGHGRLIDADTLSKDDDVTEWLSLNAVRTGKMLKRFSELFIKKIDDAPTIIEATKEVEHDKE